MLGILCSLAFAGLAGSAGCHREIVAPGQDVGAFSTVSVSNACTQVRFRVSGNSNLTVTLPDSSCGSSPFRIVSGGTHTWKKNEGQHLTIRIRVVNQDSVPYSIPRLILPYVGGKTVIDPEGLGCCYMHAYAADTAVAYETATWNLYPDTTAGAPADTLRPGSTTAVKTLEFQIRSPVVEGRFNYDIVAELASQGHGFPVVAPDSEPAWFQDDSSYSQGFLKRVLVIGFSENATIAQKQAAVDSVLGQVVGGNTRTNDPGDYYILIAGSNALDTLFARAAVARRQPGVDNARFLILARKRWRVPVDSQRWRVTSPDSVSPDSTTWAYNMVNAPLAWGCSVGSGTVRVGVVDLIHALPT